MSHDHFDGMLTVAKLKRRLLGGAVYSDVTIRRSDGDVRRIGTVVVLDDLGHALVPGSWGRFYFYDVLGSKGLFGFRPLGRPAHAFFPRRWEIIMGVAALLNALTFSGWLLLEGRIAWFPIALFALTLTSTLVFGSTRRAAMRTYRADDHAALPDLPMAAALRT